MKWRIFPLKYIFVKPSLFSDSGKSYLHKFESYKHNGQNIIKNLYWRDGIHHALIIEDEVVKQGILEILKYADFSWELIKV